MKRSSRFRSGVAAVFSRITSIEPIVLVVLALVTGASLGFVEIAGEVLEGDTESFDRWAVRSLRGADNPEEPIGPPWLEELGRDATALGGIGWLTFTVVVVAIYFWLNGQSHMMGFMLAATSGGAIVCSLLKRLFDRPRPDLVPHLSHVTSSSFPSGHSMLSAVVYLTLGSLLAAVMPTRALKIYVLGVAVVLSVIVGISRVYLGVHYPTDVLAGWLAGLIWALGCWVVARWLQHRGKVEEEAHPR